MTRATPVVIFSSLCVVRVRVHPPHSILKRLNESTPLAVTTLWSGPVEVRRASGAGSSDVGNLGFFSRSLS